MSSKLPVTCIYTLGRSGSNFLYSMIRKDKQLALGELFTPTSQSCRNRLSEYLEELSHLNLIPKELPNQYSLLCESVLDKRDWTKHRAEYENTEYVDTFKKVYSFELFKLVTSALASNQKVKESLLKYMGWWDSPTMQLNFREFQSQFDCLIFLYRNDTLRQWISTQRAIVTEDWISFEKNGKAVNPTKITWSKKKFKAFQEGKKTLHQKMLANFKGFHGPKVMLCYEGMATAATPKEYVKQQFIANNVDLDVPAYYATSRQSDPNAPLEDSFLNEEEFLSDYEEIRPNLLLHEPNYG